MKKLFSRLPHKSLAIVAGLVTVFGIAAGAHAWYPDRPTYTTAVPADHVTFNSITDNKDEGDERAFFQVKDASNTQIGGFSHSTTVHDGEEVMLRVYVHNDAADNLNTVSDGKGGFKGVATNTQVRVWLPSVSDSTMRANAYVSADNAAPQEVSDTVDFAAPVSNQKFTLTYEPGTAVAYNNQSPNGLKLSDNIVTTGAKIGESKADGVVPGCFQYANIVTLKVKVHLTTPNFSMSKTVALPGDKAWSKSVNAQPGQTVKYEINFKNTGSTTLNNVVVRDELPKGMKIVPGSTKIYNSNYPNGTAAGTDDIVANGGISIGSYVPLDAAALSDSTRQSAEVDFEATVPNSDQLQCGNNTFTNLGQVIVNGQDETDTAVVTVSKTCETPKTPTYTCDAFHVTTGDNRTVKVDKFTTSQTNGATFKDVVINWGDNTAPLTTNTAVGKTHQYGKDGTYTINAVAHFTVNGEDKTASGSCSQVVTFTTPGTPPPSTPPTLVNTGPGQVAGLFAAVTVAGAFAHRLFLSRRLAR